jgi:hypothetical protein
VVDASGSRNAHCFASLTRAPAARLITLYTDANNPAMDGASPGFEMYGRIAMHERPAEIDRHGWWLRYVGGLVVIVWGIGGSPLSGPPMLRTPAHVPEPFTVVMLGCFALAVLRYRRLGRRRP